MHNLNIRIILIIHLIFPHIGGIFPTWCFEVVDHFILGCDDVMFKKTSSLQLELCNLWMLGHPQYNNNIISEICITYAVALIDKRGTLFQKKSKPDRVCTVCVLCRQKGRERGERNARPGLWTCPLTLL